MALYALAPEGTEALDRARALAFSLLALSPLMHAFNCSSPIRSVLLAKPFVSVPLVAAVVLSAAIHLVAVLVPTLPPVFNTFPVSLAEWGLVLGFGFLVIPAMEISSPSSAPACDRRGRSPRLRCFATEPPGGMVGSRRGRR